MIIPRRTPEGRLIPVALAEKAGWIVCPFSYHYHSGDEIEIELELIICRDQAEKAIKGWDSGYT